MNSDKKIDEQLDAPPTPIRIHIHDLEDKNNELKNDVINISSSDKKYQSNDAIDRKQYYRDSKEKSFETVDLHPNKKKSNRRNNPDESGMELLLISIGEKAMGCKWLHDQEYIYHTKYDQYLRMALNFFVSLIALEQSIVIAKIYDSPAMDTLQLLIIFVSAVIYGIKDTADHKIVSLDHKNISVKYASIYHAITQYLVTPIKDRIDYTRFVSEQIKEYESLSSNTLIIRQTTKDRYNRYIENKNISNIDDIEKIRYAGKIPIQRLDTAQQNRKTDIDTFNKFEFDRWNQKF